MILKKNNNNYIFMIKNIYIAKIYKNLFNRYLIK